MENIGEDWHRLTAERIGQAVARYRRDRGLTAQQLAERCRELGAPIHRTTITKIENGRSRFDLGDWLILSAALDVSPIQLLYPDMPDGIVEFLPGETGSSISAAMWVSGETSEWMSRPVPPDSEFKAQQIMDWSRERAKEEQKRRSRMAMLAQVDQPEAAEKIIEAIELSDARIQVLNRFLHEIGAKVEHGSTQRADDA